MQTVVTFLGGKRGEVSASTTVELIGHYTRAGLIGWLEVLGYRVVRLIDVRESN